MTLYGSDCTRKRACRIAKEITGDGCYVDAPKLIQTLQHCLYVADTDLSKFVVGVFLTRTDIERFMTPESEHDGLFLINGLREAEHMEEAFRLFDTPADALAMSRRFNWSGWTLYSLRIDSRKAMVYLTPVCYP